MVKKTLHIYQLYKQNLKIWFLFLLVSLLGACTQKPMPKPEQVSSIAPVSSWTLQSIPERIDDPNISNCEPLDLKPIKPQEIINIDDVVQNCSYQTGYILYNTRLGSSQTLFAKMRIWKNFITYDDPDLYSESTPCEYQGKLYNEIDVYDTPSGSKDDNKSDFLNFLIRTNMQEKNLVEYGSELNDLMRDNTQRHYWCKEKALCKKLIPKTYGQKWNHYFLFGYKSSESREKNLILDDKVYSIWDFDYFSSALPFVKQWPWTPIELKKDKLIIRRYTNGKLLDPNKTNYQEKEQMWTFQLQTCEIPL